MYRLTVNQSEDNSRHRDRLGNARGFIWNRVLSSRAKWERW